MGNWACCSGVGWITCASPKGDWVCTPKVFHILPCRSRRTEHMLAQQGFALAVVDSRILTEAYSYPFPDPFDSVITSTAKVLDVPLMTKTGNQCLTVRQYSPGISPPITAQSGNITSSVIATISSTSVDRARRPRAVKHHKTGRFPASRRQARHWEGGDDGRQPSSVTYRCTLRHNRMEYCTYVHYWDTHVPQ